MESVKARVKKVLFNEDSFVIFAIGDNISAKGHLININAPDLMNLAVDLKGDWETDSKQRKVFNFTSLDVLHDKVHFFLHKQIKLSDKISREISNKLGDSTFEIIEKRPNELLKFKGITEKKLVKILASWNEMKEKLQLSNLLAKAGVTSNLINTIYENFGDSAVKILKENPYALVDIRGIGFKTADNVAIKLGVSKDSPERMRACAKYSVLEKIESDGHSAILSLDAIKQMQKTMADEEGETVHFDVCKQALKELLLSKEISFVDTFDGDIEDGIVNGSYISTPALIAMERMILSQTKKSTAGGEIHHDIEKWIADFEKRSGKPFGDQQKDAIRLANTMPGIFSISGYAGTGKTTVSKAILELVGMQFSRDEIACCALAGIAANRVKMQSGFDGVTIHSLLQFNPYTGLFTKNSDDKLHQKLILLDEGSMVDTAMMNALFKAIDFNKTTLIILGDPAQLPPVGPGQPYADMIKHNLIPNVTLTKIYRQSEDKMITSLAANVRKGIVPETHVSYDDFKFHDHTIKTPEPEKLMMTKEQKDAIREANHEVIKATISNIAKENKKDLDSLLKGSKFWDYITKFQIAAPMRKGTLGVTALNQFMQSVLNPNPHRTMVVGDKKFGIGDKIVHLKNQNMEIYPVQSFSDKINLDDIVTDDKRVFNGQLGVVVNAEKDALSVYYPIEKFIAKYTEKDIKSGIVDLSYVLTVHKTQGSEFNTVVIPMTTSYYNMLNPKLMYTAMTRAKEKLFIVGQKNAFKVACHQTVEQNKVTCIGLWSDKESNKLNINNKEMPESDIFIQNPASPGKHKRIFF